ncbi:M56 family metallopeptidase [Actinomarinicola tropica]|uniref:M48 family metalloprotease n=1 Tax=Actinomarinicola tropica TaxID=2789776 RepID=A0A5Q2REW0_9ACTN|nr:M56 family metallopeptidase [Actinomarinicola tropica]QGG94164.1 M48 family metalloprotease [Actinomarinicola tropica]
MTLVVSLGGLGLLLLPWLLRRRLAQLSPAEWTRATSVSLRIGLGLVQFGLLATAAPTVLGGVGAHKLADTCNQILGPPAPGGDLTGWASLGVLGWVLLTRWHARRHVRQVTDTTRIEAWLGSHTRADGFDLAVIPATRPLAYSVPGPNPQIVLSEGLHDAMTAEELAAVIRHETSHLRRRHHRELVLACEIEAVFARIPALARATSVLRLAVERCADEDAITRPEDRHDVRSALTKAAESIAGAVAAFTPADTILARLAALDHPQSINSTRRAQTVAMIGAPVTIGVAAAATWTLTSHHLLLGLLSFCLD